MPSPSRASSRRARCRATTRSSIATSILDYVFRELAVSYLGRFDLAHVDPTESGFDALGKGVAEGKAPEGQSADQVSVEGFDALAHRQARGAHYGLPGRRQLQAATRNRRPATTSRRCAPAARRGEVAGAVALKPEEPVLSPAQALENLTWSEPRVDYRAVAAEKRAEAKAKGYEGEACGECGNFTLVRNGTCMKCDTCGGTTGCS